MSSARWLLGGVLMLATVVTSPLSACRGGQPASFTFGTDEVRAAIEGTWILSLPATSSTPTRTLAVRIEIAQAPQHSAARPGLIASAYACSTRTLIKSAAACIDVTKVALVVTALDGDIATAQGALDVYGLSFHNSRLELLLDDVPVSAMVSPAGEATDVRVATLEGGTLTRTAR